jgi:hypothetical protein
MRKKLHRVTIFFDDKEMKRVYNAVAKEEMLPSKLLKKVVLEYLDKLETEDENFENPRPEDLAVVEDKDAIIL